MSDAEPHPVHSRPQGTLARAVPSGRPASHVFDGSIKAGLQLAQMTAQVPHHAVRGDHIPAGPFHLGDDKHLLIAVHFNGQVDAPRHPGRAATDVPLIPVPRRARSGRPTGQSCGSLACRQSLVSAETLPAWPLW
jgi:hypothetical protein